MPELPEVETTVRGLSRVLEGRRIDRVEVTRPDLRRAFPHNLGQRLTGTRVERLGRRAKYGLIYTNRHDVLVFHLGMSGRWRIDPPKIEKHDHLLLTTEEGRLLALNDPRRFGSVDLVAEAELSTWPPLADMGPEPTELEARDLHRRLAGRTAAIKLLLLDQRIVAGLGNIYVCEALHRAGIDPRRAGGKISLSRIQKLVPAIRDVIGEAIEAGGSSLRDFASPTGELGYFSKSFAVYDREGQHCECGKPVRRIVQGGRSTFFCNGCQR